MNNNNFSDARRDFLKKSSAILLSASLPFQNALSSTVVYPLLPPTGRIFLVKEGGFNTGPSITTNDTASGRLWSDLDWINENCLNAAEGFNLLRYLTNPNDILVWDAQPWQFNTTQTLDAAPSVPGLIRIWSRYLDPLSTSFSQLNTAVRLFTLEKHLAEGSLEIEFKGISLTRTDTSMVGNGTLLKVSGDISGIYFDKVIIGGFSASGRGRLIDDEKTNYAIKRRFGFFNTEFNSLNLSGPGTNTGILSTSTSTEVEIANTNLRNIYVQLDAATNFTGLFNIQGGLRAKGMEIDNISINGAGDRSTLRGIFSQSQYSTKLASLENITARNSSINNGEVQALILHSGARHTVNNLLLVNCHARPSTVSHNLGLAVLSLGQFFTPALGIYNKITAIDCSAQFGLLVYASGGAQAIGSNLHAYNCEVEAGMIYAGGSGDMEVDGLIVQGSRSTSTTGLSVYAHNVYRPDNNTPEVRNKTVSVHNVTSRNNSFIGGSSVDKGYGADIWLTTYNPRNTMTLLLRNYTGKNPKLLRDIVVDRKATDGPVFLNLVGARTHKPLAEAVINTDKLAIVDIATFIQTSLQDY